MDEENKNIKHITKSNDVMTDENGEYVDEIIPDACVQQSEASIVEIKVMPY